MKKIMSNIEAHTEDSLLEYLKGTNTELLCNHKTTLFNYYGKKRNGVTKKMIEISKKFEFMKENQNDYNKTDFDDLGILYRNEMDRYLKMILRKRKLTKM